MTICDYKWLVDTLIIQARKIFFFIIIIIILNPRTSPELESKSFSICWANPINSILHCYCCYSVAKLYLTLCSPMDCSTPGFPVLHHRQEFAQTHVHWVCDAIQQLTHSLSALLLLPSIFPSMTVFYSESALCIRCPKYWSFSFSINPSNEYSELISFRIDWFDLLAV